MALERVGWNDDRDGWDQIPNAVGWLSKPKFLVNTYPQLFVSLER